MGAQNTSPQRPSSPSCTMQRNLSDHHRFSEQRTIRQPWWAGEDSQGDWSHCYQVFWFTTNL